MKNDPVNHRVEAIPEAFESPPEEQTASGIAAGAPRMQGVHILLTTILSTALLLLSFTPVSEALGIFTSPLPTISPISPLPTVSPLPDPPTFVSPLRIHVDDTATGAADGTSWTDAFTDLQDALDIAVTYNETGDVEIWVAEGRYVPSARTESGDPRSATFQLLDHVEIYGGFRGDERAKSQRDWEAHPTVLSGDLGGDDTTDAHGILAGPSGIAGSNAYHVTTAFEVDETAVLDGFFITGGQADSAIYPHYYGGGIRIWNASPSLRHLVFRGNMANKGGGGACIYHSESTLTGIHFINNTSGRYGGGVYVSNSDPLIASALFTGNTASIGGAVANYFDSNLALINATLVSNTATETGGAVGAANSNLSAVNTVMWDNTAPLGAQISKATSMATIAHSLIQGCGGSGTGWDTSLGIDGGGNIDADPEFVDPASGDYHLDRALSPAVDAGDDQAVPADVTTDLDGYPRIVGAAVDMGAYEIPPIFVDDTASGANDGTTWSDAFIDLQDALDLAASYGSATEIWMAQGLYVPSAEATAGDPRSVTFPLVDDVAIYGGFWGDETQRSQRNWEAYPTVLSGDIDGDDVTQPTGVLTDSTGIRGSNAYNVVTAYGVGQTAVLDGVFVTGGQASGDYPNYYGGGIHNQYSSPSLRHITLQGNFAKYGGGIRLYYGSGATFTDTRFINNDADYGGALYNFGSSIVIANALFSGNSANYGGALYSMYSSDVIIANALFSGNSANIGGGGALYSYANDMTFVNTTFVNNSGSSYGGGMYIPSGDLTIENTVMWNNTAPADAQILSYGMLTITHSLIQDSGGSGAGWDASLGFDGGGNIDADPQFVDPADDYRLRLDSPAVDAGDNAALPPSVTTDLAGAPRFVDVAAAPDTGSGTPPLVDMGAYEAMLTLYAPPDATGPAGSEDGVHVIVPITMGGDATDLGIYSFQFTMAMDPGVLAPVAYLQRGAMTEGWSIVTSQPQPGEVFIGGYSTTPLSGTDEVLIYVICEVTGALGDETDLVLDGIPFNEGQPPATTIDGHFTVNDVMLSGDVVYGVNGKPVPDAEVSVTGPVSAVETTDEDGRYAVTVSAMGTYTTSVAKSGDTEGTISALDAAWIAEHVAGTRLFNDHEQAAADVNQSGRITTYDAAIVLQYSAGLTTIPSRTGEWDFQPPQRVYPAVQWSFTQERFNAHIFGDVTGNWGTSSDSLRIAALRSAPAVMAPQMEAEPGDDVVVPIEIERAPRFNTLAYDLALAYDAGVLRYLGASLDDTLLSGGTMAVNDTRSDELIVSAYSLEPSQDQEGALLHLTFEVVGEVGDYTEIAFRQLDINEGNPAVESVAGGLEVADLTPPETVDFEPVDAATDVPVDGPLVITFTEPISSATFDATLSDYAGPLTETWSTDDSVVTLTHDVLESEQLYTVTLTAADDRAGNPLHGAPVSWTFTTIDAEPPEVQDVNPAENATGVDLAAPIVITFTDSIDTSSLGYTLTPTCDVVTVTWNAISTVVTLEHTVPFTMLETYTVSVTSRDDAGNAMVAPYQWTFFTWEGNEVFLPLVIAPRR